MRDSYPFTAATTPGGDVARVVEPGFRQGRRRARARLSVNVVPGQFRMILTRTRIQATSYKRQAASFKRQAASDKVLDRGAWIKYWAASSVGRNQDKCISRMLDMEGNLVR